MFLVRDWGDRNIAPFQENSSPPKSYHPKRTRSTSNHYMLYSTWGVWLHRTFSTADLSTTLKIFRLWCMSLVILEWPSVDGRITTKSGKHRFFGHEILFELSGGGFFVSFPQLANGPWNKSLNSISLLNMYIIPKSLKFSHWPSRFQLSKWTCDYPTGKVPSPQLSLKKIHPVQLHLFPEINKHLYIYIIYILYLRNILYIYAYSPRLAIK